MWFFEEKNFAVRAPIFWNWTFKNIANRQQSFSKIAKNWKSLHPTVSDLYG